MSHRGLYLLVLLGALAAGLTACGRKGPLDPPPGASLEGEPQARMPGLMSTNAPLTNSGGTMTKSNAKKKPDAEKTAVQPPKKHIPLDVLLN